MFNSAKSTLKDRKFWTGLMMGAVMTGTVAMLQPLNAATPTQASDPGLKVIASAMASMMKSQQAMQSDLAAVKSSAASMDASLKALKEASTLNQPQPR